MKKPIKILLICLASLVVLAILAGVLNALVGDGTWIPGWQKESYDETGYTVGGGTVATENLRKIDVDWNAGTVTVEICEDQYPSLTEQSGETLPESAFLRWKIGEDGTFSVRFRKAGWRFSLSGGQKKDLILRIPERLLAGVEKITVRSDSADVTVVLPEEQSFRMRVETKGGMLVNDFSMREEPDGSLVCGEDPRMALTVSTRKGDVTFKAAVND